MNGFWYWFWTSLALGWGVSSMVHGVTAVSMIGVYGSMILAALSGREQP